MFGSEIEVGGHAPPAPYPSGYAPVIRTIAPEGNCARLGLGFGLVLGLGAIFLGGNCPRTIN